METQVGDVVDVTELRARMAHAVRHAGSGTAHFADPAGEWDAEVTFTLDADGTAIRICGMPYSYSERLVVDGTIYEGSTVFAGFWDSRELDGPLRAGDVLGLVESIPDGEAHVVDCGDATTTFRVTADAGALAAFCDSAWVLGHPEPGTMATETLWTLDGEDRVMSIRGHEELEAWDDVTFGDWGVAPAVTAPPPVPDPAPDRMLLPGERELHGFAVQLGRHLARRDAWRAAVFVSGSSPEAPGATVERVTTQLWLLLAQEAVPNAELPVVDGDQWVAIDTMHLEMTHRFTMALATHPTSIGGRPANLLIALYTRVGDNVAVRYGWTHHPDLLVPEAGERLLDPAWVSDAITTAGLTRDW